MLCSSVSSPRCLNWSVQRLVRAAPPRVTRPRPRSYPNRRRSQSRRPLRPTQRLLPKPPSLRNRTLVPKRRQTLARMPKVIHPQRLQRTLLPSRSSRPHSVAPEFAVTTDALTPLILMHRSISAEMRSAAEHHFRRYDADLSRQVAAHSIMLLCLTCPDSIRLSEKLRQFLQGHCWCLPALAPGKLAS